MIEREQLALMRNYGRYPVEFVRGEGAWLYDPEGRGYLDLMAGISMINVGHCHPAVVAAIREQAGALINTSNLYYTEPMVALAEWIRDTSMGGRVFFCNSGAEALEAAIKLARKHGGPERTEFVSLEDGFHGRTMGALALTGQPDKQEAFRPLMPGARYVPRNDGDALRTAVSEHTCAIAIEIVQGECGVYPLENDFVRLARQLADESGALLIVDEIQTGMSRTGSLYAYQAFMERRLLLARELLRQNDSILVVAIDEKEYLRLGLLLEQTFPDATIQMISSVIKPGGTSRAKGFSRVEEFLFFVFIGEAELMRTNDNMLFETAPTAGLNESDLWEGMVRRGRGVVRDQRPKQFYPIFIDPAGPRIVSSDPPLPLKSPRESIEAPAGLIAVWPIKDDGSEGFWQLAPEGLKKARERGTVRVGSFNKKTGQWRIQYMKSAKAKAVADGSVATLGKDENHVVVIDLASSSLDENSTPRTVWNKVSHDASTGGAGLLNTLIPDRKFPFPKSLYAVEDALAFFVSAKPNAVVVDFFAGSGTTAHAVMRLNRRDRGRRISISVTNNEVSADEQQALRAQRLRPADPDWEKLGIFEHITRPRITAAAEGDTPDGLPLEGSYRFNDVFPLAEGLDENVEFFTLTYESPLQVASGRAFQEIAPLLWLRAGSTGPRINSLPDGWAVTETYGVIADLDQLHQFVEAVGPRPNVRVAFVITDEDRLFEAVVRGLPHHVEPVRMYDAYLRNFELESRVPR